MFTQSIIAAASSTLDKAELAKVVQPIIDVCNTLVPILLSVVAALGSIWCILLGVKYAKAEDPQEHEKAKKSLKNAIIGFVLIFILLLICTIGYKIFYAWWSTYPTGV